MIDDAYSQFVRAKKGLPDDWRVFSWEATSKGKVRMVGALARPATKRDGRQVGLPVWYRPMQMRRQITIAREEYRALAKRALAKEGFGA